MTARTATAGLTLLACLTTPALGLAAKRAKLATRSTPVALFRNDNRLAVVNREADSLTVLQVRRRGADVEDAIAKDPQGAFPNQLHALLVRGDQVLRPVDRCGARAAHQVQRERAGARARDRPPDRRRRAGAHRQPERADQARDATRSGRGQPGPSLRERRGRARRDGRRRHVLVREPRRQLRASAPPATRAARSRSARPTSCASRPATCRPASPSRATARAPTWRTSSGSRVGPSIYLAAHACSQRDVPTATPPPPGHIRARAHVGKLVFFTAFGVPRTGSSPAAPRHRAARVSEQASDNAWSSCASCHPDGLADGVTWIFATARARRSRSTRSSRRTTPRPADLELQRVIGASPTSTTTRATSRAAWASL